jgi:hypothetical protein
MGFRLTASDRPLRPHGGPARHARGACVTFEGRVRDQNDGKGVKSPRLRGLRAAGREGGRQDPREAREKFQVILGAVCVHRTGSLAWATSPCGSRSRPRTAGAAFEPAATSSTRPRRGFRSGRRSTTPTAPPNGSTAPQGARLGRGAGNEM